MQEKTQRINKKFDNSDGGNPDGDWHERFKHFLTLAHQATCIAAEANFEAQRDFLRSCGSNISLNNGSLVISYRYPWRYIAENRENRKWGPDTQGIESNFSFSLRNSPGKALRKHLSIPAPCKQNFFRKE
jgi:hypothetical protein